MPMEGKKIVLKVFDLCCGTTPTNNTYQLTEISMCYSSFFAKYSLLFTDLHFKITLRKQHREKRSELCSINCAHEEEDNTFKRKIVTNNVQEQIKTPLH